jgi:thymidylate kinase
MMFSVALIGADGAGKSTVSRQVAETLQLPVKRIYMGVNLEASGLVLPTTWLVLALKRARGRRPDMVGSRELRDRPRPRRHGLRGALQPIKSGARTAAWIGEEWFRAAVAAYWKRRGNVVVFDRHFFADYYPYDVARPARDRSMSSRVHGALLRRLYPRPDLTICLDAPADVLWARKQEASPEWLEWRREQYLAMRDVVPHFVVVDAGRSPEEVTRDVTDAIRSFHDGRLNGGRLAKEPA